MINLNYSPPQGGIDLGHVIKLHPTSSTHQRKQSVRLQIPQLSVTVQRKEKKSSRNK